MPWHSIRAFHDRDYPAVQRVRDPHTLRFTFRRSTTRVLTPQMRRQAHWYVAGWKIHLSIYPAEYPLALPALRLFETRMASTDLVYKYAASKGHYETFSGAVKGKFATLYCQSAEEVTPVIELINQIFRQDGITPISDGILDGLEGLRHELPLVGGYGFARYGAFCYTRGLLDLTDPQRDPLPDDRGRPFPLFRDPCLLENELARFRDLIDASRQNR